MSHFANLPSSVSFAFTSTIPLLTSKGHSFLRRPNVRHRRLQSGPDLQASESIHYEAMQQTQPSATTPTTLLNLEDDLHFSKQDLTGNLSMEITRHNHQIIKSYPIGYQNQLYCDQNFADLNKNKQMDSLPDDSIIQQRVIVESEQLELFLRLRPSGSISSSLMEKDRKLTLRVRIIISNH